ncbi:MAG: uncharacterized protein QOJ25_736 [Solirubrobacteraceae bacterium]|jgi:glycosyltransferase A (GT-A) superfamily protein (DUF2064 family)|nr:uncharacterized protein [Solirubrobacteraceae bacterium]
MNPHARPGPAVVVMAEAARPGHVRRALEPLLGPDGCAALQSALIVAAVTWAEEVAPGAVYVAYDPGDAGTEIRDLVAHGTQLFPQTGDGLGVRLADATGRLLDGASRPVLVVWPDLPRLRTAHATAALGDLEAGCDMSLGPTIEGGFYLIAIGRPQPKLFALPDEAWRTSDGMALAVTAQQEAGLEIGVLRTERALHRPADVRAARADPTLPPELAQILGARDT